MLTNTLDDGYADAAARRGAAGPPGPPGRARLAAVAAVFAAVGLLLTLAAVQVHRGAPAAARARAALVTQVQRQTADLESLERRERALTAQTRALRRQALGSSPGSGLAGRLADLERAAGATAVAGPGLVVTLDDAPAASPAPLESSAGEPPGTGTEAGRVYDRDLQQVVNALWAAGAEAVAVNGQRLGALSSIREAGDAILVDYRPLTPPYRVVAVGDPDTLPADFTASPTAARFRTYAQAYGLRFSARTTGHAELPAASGLALHAAAPPAGSRPARPSSTAAPTTTLGSPTTGP